MRNIITHTNKCNYTKYGLKTLAINEVINIIRTGNYPNFIYWSKENKLLSLIEATKITNKNRNSPDKQKIKKQILPVAAFNGVFSEITEKGLYEYSSFTALDIDHLDTEEDMKSFFFKKAHSLCFL